jgi:hypothetical protein
VLAVVPRDIAEIASSTAEGAREALMKANPLRNNAQLHRLAMDTPVSTVADPHASPA